MNDDPPWLVVGLGNPGAKHASHRHNVGFMVVDAWVERLVPMPSWKEKHHGLSCSISSGVPGGGRAVAIKPQTYMNVSGDCVGPAARYHRVPPQRIVVVHDELDFAPGRVAIKDGGGHGGHNGLRDLVRVLGGSGFPRVRVGIGRPPKGRGDVSRWVLSDFSGPDAAELPDTIERAGRALDHVLADGVSSAMNQFNASPAAAG